MPNTTNLQLSTPAHASNVDTWDTDPINNNSGILDSVAGNVTTKSLTNVNVNLTVLESQVSILRFTGVLTGSVGVLTNTIIKSWIVENLTTGNFNVVLGGASGNVVGLPAGSSQVYFDGTNMSFINLGRVGAYWDDSAAGVPSWVTACTVPPALLCDGSAFSGVTYPLLAAKLGTTTLPDARGRVRAQLNGGTNRLTTSGGSVDGDTRFASGGFQQITLDLSTLPSHQHTGTTDNGGVDHTHPYNEPPTQGALYGGGGVSGRAPFTDSGQTTGSASAFLHGHTFTTNAAGGGAAHFNTQPTYIGGVTLIWAA